MRGRLSADNNKSKTEDGNDKNWQSTYVMVPLLRTPPARNLVFTH